MEGEPITKKTIKSVQSVYLNAAAQPKHYQYLFCRHIERLYGAPQVVFNGKSRCWSIWANSLTQDVLDTQVESFSQTVFKHQHD